MKAGAIREVPAFKPITVSMTFSTQEEFDRFTKTAKSKLAMATTAANRRGSVLASDARLVQSIWTPIVNALVLIGGKKA